MDNFDYRKYLAEGKLLREEMELEFFNNDEDVALIANSGEYEAEIENGKVSFSVAYDDGTEFDDSTWKSILGPKHAFVEIASKIPTEVEAIDDYVMITVDLEDLKGIASLAEGIFDRAKAKIIGKIEMKESEIKETPLNKTKMKKSELKEMIKTALSEGDNYYEDSMDEAETTEVFTDAELDMADKMLMDMFDKLGLENNVEKSDALVKYINSWFEGLDFVNEAEEVDVEDNEEVDVDIEKDVEIDDESVETDIDVKGSMPGEDEDEIAVQSLLMKAQEEAEKLGDEKLTDQIGNTITYFTRAHVATVDEAKNDIKETLVDADQDMAEAILNALGGEAAFEAVVRAMSTDDAQIYLGGIIRDYSIGMGDEAEEIDEIAAMPGEEGVEDINIDDPAKDAMVGLTESLRWKRIAGIAKDNGLYSK